MSKASGGNKAMRPSPTRVVIKGSGAKGMKDAQKQPGGGSAYARKAKRKK